MEHAVRSINHDPNVYGWLTTKGVYTSCHDLISRILQFDVDGDQLNVVVEPVIVEAAKRNIEKYNIIPLFYDANKAASEQLSPETIFGGLKRAHDFSGIGQVSNALTKLWNRDHPDREAAAWLCFYNNQVIDAAKTGKINSYESYPAVLSRINKAVGGKAGRMPWFFQYSKNGRKTLYDRQEKKKTYARQNKSAMNRLCQRFDAIGNINFNFAGVAPFNWQMLLLHPCLSNRLDVVKAFCDLDDANVACIAEAKSISDMGEREDAMGYDLIREAIVDALTAMCGSLENAYPYIVKHLFAGDGADKVSHKQMFWRVFGDMAVRNLEQNLSFCRICGECGMRIPAWVEKHYCIKISRGFYECVDCGAICQRTHSRQSRCEKCQQQRRFIKSREYSRAYRDKRDAKDHEKTAADTSHAAG